MDFQPGMVAGGNYGGNFSRNLERVCVDFQNAILAEGATGSFYKEFGECLRGFSKTQYWQEETLGEFTRKLERVCVIYWREETMGDFFPAIWRGFAWISKKQYWPEDIMGEFFGKFGEGLRGCPKSHIGGRKPWGNFFRKFGEGLEGGNYGEIFLRNLERVGVDFQKAIVTGGKSGGVFQEIGEGLRGYTKAMMAGGNYGGIF